MSARNLLASALMTCLAASAMAQSPRFVTTAWPWGGGWFNEFTAEPSGCILAAGLGLVRSCDGGRTWTSVRDANGAVLETVGATLVDSATGRILVTGFAQPLRILDSAAGVWRALASTVEMRPAFVVAGEHDSVLYAVATSGVHRSGDLGATWTIVHASQRSHVYDRPFAVDRLRGLLYLFEGNALLRSSDGGATWTRMADSLLLAVRSHLAVTSSGTVFAANDHGVVLRSLDSGRSWTPVAQQLGAAAVRAVHVAASGRIYLGAAGGVALVSSDDGATWSALQPEPAGKPLVALLELSPGVVLGAVEYDDRSIVRHEGSAWSFSANGVSGKHVGRPAISPTGLIYVPVVGSGVFYRSSDGGGTWHLDSTGIARAYSAALGMTERGTLLVGLNGNGVARSTDGGNAWTVSSSSFGSTFERSQSWFDTDRFGRVWVGTGSGAFSSPDDGITWYPTMQGLKFTSVAVGRVGTILLGTGKLTGHDLLYRSVDGGASYEVSNNGVGDGVRAIEYLPSGDVLLATNNGLRISRDDGRTWSTILPDSLDVLILSMVVDRYGAVYAATPNAIYVSRDTAQTWTRWTDGLSGSIQYLAIDSSGVLYVATSGAGVLKSAGPVASAPAGDEGEASTVDRIVVRRGEDVSITINDAGAAGDPGALRVEVFDVDGRRVASAVPGASDHITIPLRELPAGVYVARVEGMEHRRVVVLHVAN